MSIQKKVVITILIAGFIALSIGLSVTYYQVRTILTEAIGRDFVEIAKKTAERFDVTVKKEINTFQRLAVEPSFIKAVKEGQIETIEDHLAHYLRYTEEKAEHLGLFVVNEKGRIIGNSKLMIEHSSDQSEEDWWKMTYNNGVGRLYASDIYLDKSIGRRAFDICIPVFDPLTGRVIGAIRSIMNVDVFFNFIKEMSFGKTGHGMLVDSEGTPLICSILPPVEHSMNQPLIDLITSKKGGWAIAKDDAHGGRNSIIGFSSVKYIDFFGPENLGGHKWYTFIRQAPEETFAPVNRLMLKVLLLESIIVLLICALGVYIVRRFLFQPVSILRDGVERISRGDFDHKIDIETGDELETLADGFNSMSSSLKGFYYNLEEQIEERAAALKASETKYRALMEQAYDAIFLINPESGQIMEANLQAEVLTGLSRKEILNIKYWDLYPKEMIPFAKEHFSKGVKGGFATLHNVPIKRKDSKMGWVDISARLIAFNNVKIYHAMMKDISERKKEEEKLSMTDEQLARLTKVMLEQDSRLATLQQKINYLVKHLDMSEIPVFLFKIISERLGITQMAIFEKTGEVLKCNWSYGIKSKMPSQLNIPIKENDPVNYAIRDLKVVKKGDFDKLSFIDRYVRNWTIFPLRGKDMVIGVFVVGPNGPESKEEILQPFVDIAAIVLEKEKSIKDVRR